MTTEKTKRLLGKHHELAVARRITCDFFRRELTALQAEIVAEEREGRVDDGKQMEQEAP